MTSPTATTASETRAGRAERRRAVIVHAAGRTNRITASEVHAALLEAGCQAELVAAEALRHRLNRDHVVQRGPVDLVVSIGALAESLRLAAPMPHVPVFVAGSVAAIRQHLDSAEDSDRRSSLAAASIGPVDRCPETLIGSFTISSSTKGRSIAVHGLGPARPDDHVWHLHVTTPIPHHVEVGGHADAITVAANAESGESTFRLQPDDRVTIASRHGERLRLLFDDGHLVEADGPIELRRHPVGIPFVDLTTAP
ncbi:MAG: hypothetical protein WD225_07230 [Ilumatobacteraceae bacterium]